MCTCMDLNRHIPKLFVELWKVNKGGYIFIIETGQWEIVFSFLGIDYNPYRKLQLNQPCVLHSYGPCVIFPINQYSLQWVGVFKR